MFKKFLKEPIQMLILIMLSTSCICFYTINFLHEYFEDINTEYLEYENNENTRTKLVGILQKNLALLHANFQYMLLSSSKTELDTAHNNIKDILYIVKNNISILENGGIYTDTLYINFGNHDKIEESFFYKKSKEIYTDVTSIELQTSLSRLENIEKEYYNFIFNMLQDQDTYKNKNDLVIMHKKLAPLFNRIIETSNRIYYDSNKLLEESIIRRQKHHESYKIAMSTLSFTSVFFILFVGFLVIKKVIFLLNEKLSAQQELKNINNNLEITIFERTKKLQHSENTLKNIALTSDDIIWQIDTEGYILSISGTVFEILGYEPIELIGQKLRIIAPSIEQDFICDSLRNIFSKRENIKDIIMPFAKKNGENGYLRMNAVPIFNEGIFDGYIGVGKDITKEIDQDKRLELYKKTFDTSIEAICITDKNVNIIEINKAFTDITGYSYEDVKGKNPKILKSEFHHKIFYGTMWKKLLKNDRWSGEIWNKKKDGTSFPTWISISVLRDIDNNIVNYVALFHDITDLKKTEEQVRHMAYHDSLTGLPNRILFYDKLNMAIVNAKNNNHKIAVLYVDIDNFKNINDSLGHDIGDKLLINVANRFTTLIRKTDTVARLGGDEFVFLVEMIPQNFDINHFAERIINVLSAPINVLDYELYVSPSIGIAVCPDDGCTPDELLKHSDLAMYKAKTSGKNQYHIFKEELNILALKRLSIENNLRNAIINSEIFPLFQPRLDTEKNEIIGIEALARWKMFDTFIPPSEFIPIAEETSLIIDLGKSILYQSCIETKKIIQSTGKNIPVAVNVSARQFAQPDFVDTIVHIIKATDFDPKYLELEITESMLINDIDSTKNKLEKISNMGIKVSIDDFGTGYSSLLYLNKLPIDLLKIDKTFVAGLSNDKDDYIIVKTIIQMALNMELDILAEGVETQEQLDILYSLGCKKIQGFLFSKPVTSSDIIVLVNKK